jgi:hypothetical protein
MTKAKPKAPNPKAVELTMRSGETESSAMARIMLGPDLRHGHIASTYGGQMFGDKVERPGIMDCAEQVRARAELAVNGDMTMASQMLAAQAMTLDTMFTALAERAFNNLGHYPQTAERYGRLALKAQANARATLEALAKLHQPREQTVRHVHVGQGGQAVVADQFHHHNGGAGNAVIAEQCHATGEPGERPALPGPNPLGDTVPIAGGEREATLQDARRHESRRTEG